MVPVCPILREAQEAEVPTFRSHSIRTILLSLGIRPGWQDMPRGHGWLGVQRFRCRADEDPTLRPTLHHIILENQRKESGSTLLWSPFPGAYVPFWGL